MEKERVEKRFTGELVKAVVLYCCGAVRLPKKKLILEDDGHFMPYNFDSFSEGAFVKANYNHILPFFRGFFFTNSLLVA